MKLEVGENCIMRYSIAFTPHQILLNYHDKDGKEGRAYSTYGIGVHTDFRQ
jgi:hypothetical protein